MSTSSTVVSARAAKSRPGDPTINQRLRTYFASDAVRTAQVALGLAWLLDGALQFQSFMYSHAFPRTLVANAVGQPTWVHSSVVWGAKLANGNLTVFNTLFALVQISIGFGLLSRRTVKPALAAGFVWAFVVWWFGEAFGMLFTGTAQPLTGAPGAVLLYAMVGLLVWPNGRPGGLLGVRGARLMWAALWLAIAYLWLLAPSSGANAIHDAITSAPSGMGWLHSVQHSAADIARGNGLLLALVFAALSAMIGVGVAVNRLAPDLLLLSAIISLVFWLVGQGLGGIFAGGATDPNSGPLFILLAYVLWSLVPLHE